MKAIIQNLTLIFIAVFTVSLFFAPTVSAVTTANNLVVEFENTPLFSEANFVPGDGVTRWVKVTNNSQDAKSILIEAINFSNPGNLGDNLELTIKEGSTELFSDTLANFFSYGEVFLSDLAGDGGSTQYDLNIRFPENADNASMQDSLAFDILIGFSGNGDGGSEGDGNNGGGNNGVIITGGGGGSQGTSGYRGLTISNEAVFDIVPTTGTAEIFWNTSHAATSQVVYGLVSGGPYILNLSDPKFGYPFATPEDSTKVTEHYMNISGLIPGETYNYRVISHASPATVSFEHTFFVPFPENTDSKQNIETENTAESPSTENEQTKETPALFYASNNTPTAKSNNPVFYDTTKDNVVLSSEEKEVSSQQKEPTAFEDDNNDNKGLASIFSAFSLDKLFSAECADYTIYLLLIFIIAYILRSLWEKKNKDSGLSKKELLNKRILYFIKLTIALLVSVLILKISCSLSLLIIILAFLLAGYLLNKRIKK